MLLGISKNMYRILNHTSLEKCTADLQVSVVHSSTIVLWGRVSLLSIQSYTIILYKHTRPIPPHPESRVEVFRRPGKSNLTCPLPLQKKSLKKDCVHTTPKKPFTKNQKRCAKKPFTGEVDLILGKTMNCLTSLWISAVKTGPCSCSTPHHRTLTLKTSYWLHLEELPTFRSNRASSGE